MSRYNPDEQVEPVFDVAEQWKVKCLLGGGSLFADRDLWVLENINELITHFVNNPDTGGNKFWEKLENQLQPASENAKLLAAEILYIEPSREFRRPVSLSHAAMHDLSIPS